MVYTEGLNAAYEGIANVAGFTKKMGVGMLNTITGFGGQSQQVKLPPDLQNLQVSKLVYTGGPIVQIAAVSGALAVVLGAYGAHNLPLKEDFKDREEIYQTANKYHFFHSLALLGAPLCSFPRTVASFMSLGLVLFCGVCYYQAFTGEKNLRKLTPIGGTCFILGWLWMVL